MAQPSKHPWAPRVGVWPPEERHRRGRLFDALAEAFGVRIEAGLSPGDGSEAAICFIARGKDLPEGLPERRLLLPLLADRSTGGTRHRVLLHGSSEVDSRLRGRTLTEGGDAPGGEAAAGDGATVLASCEGVAVWRRRREANGAVTDEASVAPPEIGAGEALRDRFAARRWLALLPLLELLREVSGYSTSGRPALRAAFVLDDPNLHWTSYGHVRYPELQRSAERNDYHVVMATVPLDGWFARERAARLFRAPGSRLSLAIHGNDHLARELERPTTPEHAGSVLRQALARVERLERRARVRVARVMVPPHGVCSEQVMRALARLGFEGVSINRPFPWVARRGDSAYAHPAPHRPLTGWYPADVVADGAPVLMRHSLAGPRDQLLLNAYLDQPVILYGHHDDLAGGLEGLEDAAAQVNALGEVRWCGLQEIARSSYSLTSEGNTARVTLFSRRAVLELPPDVRELEVTWPESLQMPERIECRQGEAGTSRRQLPADEARVRFSLPDLHDDRRVELWFPAAAGEVADVPATSLWSVARRVLAEGRDRLEPFTDRKAPVRPAR